MERNDKYIERYKELGCAIIQQAVEDYMEDVIDEAELYYFLYHTLWIECLDIDVESLFEKVRDKKRCLEEQRTQANLGQQTK